MVCHFLWLVIFNNAQQGCLLYKSENISKKNTFINVLRGLSYKKTFLFFQFLLQDGIYSQFIYGF